MLLIVVQNDSCKHNVMLDVALQDSDKNYSSLLFKTAVTNTVNAYCCSKWQRQTLSMFAIFSQDGSDKRYLMIAFVAV